MLRSADLFHQALAERGLKVDLLRPRQIAGKLTNKLPRLQKLLGIIDKFILFPVELMYFTHIRRGKNIVFHIVDQSNAIYSFLLVGKPYIVTCNDVISIRSARGEIGDNPITLAGRLVQAFILTRLRHAKRIICISQNTARELRPLVGEGKGKITVALMPLNFDFYPVNREEALIELKSLPQVIQEGVQSKFILHVGGNHWYKNRVGVCNIFKSLTQLRVKLNAFPISLLMAGETPSTELLNFCGENPGLDIRFIINPTNKQVRALYALATVLLFPSLQEGFGWPIAEALACGCPVVTSSKSPMTDVGGEAAIYISPTEHTSASAALNSVVEWESSYREKTRIIGLESVKRFDRRSFIDHYIDAYGDVIRTA